MTKLYFDISGELIAFIQRDDELIDPPELFANTLEFDPNTNQSIINSVNTDWNAHSFANGQLIYNGNPVIINPPGDEWNANADIKSGYPILPDWVKTATADQVQQYVTNNVWSGQTKTQVNAWIDANVIGNNVATLRTNVIIALKLIASAIIDLRDLMALQAKLIVYLRDLVLRFKKL